MHYMGHGKAVQLAKALRGAQAESKTPLDKPASPVVATLPIPASWKLIAWATPCGVVKVIPCSVIAPPRGITKESTPQQSGLSCTKCLRLFLQMLEVPRLVPFWALGRTNQTQSGSKQH
jgi:hypothetical protein